MPSPRETVLCHYHYDPLDRLISHALPNIPERQRFYCKSRLATEIQGAMRYSIVQHGDQLLGQQRSEGDAPDTTLLATDQQRSVLQTLKADRPPQPIAYSPYGHRPVESGLLSLLGFNGERPDPVTGCYLLGNGYRAFNPVLMRFNSPDNLSPFGVGGLNAYIYCGGEPVLGSDPTGHKNIARSLWKGIQNLFIGRTPSKLRTPTSVVKTNSTADLTSSQLTSNTARQPSNSSFSSTQSAGSFNPRHQRSDSLLEDADMSMFEQNPKNNIENLMSSPKSSRQQNGTTSSRSPSSQNLKASPRVSSQQYKSLEELELRLQLAHDERQMMAYINGDRDAFNKPFTLSDHRKYIREQGF
ncbi:RHS repeat-associated core domain-containing protein [Pseudomonas sp. Irchel s3h17]|uniref:RHS repeat-associated core domain-containing protein n=1 Tax=Pseudomonas sp. Irchel s3h17 TaxID=2009182 RepID=UPI000BA433AC|nr:RHS repeat-associated core domain-containing protein [Pseudomonas sp. Irchel s3h17]